MAFHERSTITTRLTILKEASSPRQQEPQPQTTFPSNLANRRNVGGPTPLNDIFRH